MLGLFSLAAIINQIGWIAFAPLSDILKQVFKLSLIFIELRSEHLCDKLPLSVLHDLLPSHESTGSHCPGQEGPQIRCSNRDSDDQCRPVDEMPGQLQLRLCCLRLDYYSHGPTIFAECLRQGVSELVPREGAPQGDSSECELFHCRGVSWPLPPIFVCR